MADASAAAATRAERRRDAGPDLATRVGAVDWYHTLDLPGGVTTRGYFDLRPIVDKLPLPDSLVGKRCLDLASADGFFAFEMARRGGEVVSVDLADTTRQDWQGPPGVNEERRQSTGRASQAFGIACEAYGFDIERHDLSIYDVTPELVGTFDYIFMGNVLMHLGDPGRALHAARSVLRPDGEFCSFEGVALALSLVSPGVPAALLHDQDEPRWWTHNMAGHRRVVEAGGFAVIDQGGPWIFQPLGEFIPKWPSSFPRRWREWVFWLGVRRKGCASSWVRSRVRPLADAAS